VLLCAERRLCSKVILYILGVRTLHEELGVSSPGLNRNCVFSHYNVKKAVLGDMPVNSR
jgi:hypothetical protein